MKKRKRSGVVLMEHNGKQEGNYYPTTTGKTTHVHEIMTSMKMRALFNHYSLVCNKRKPLKAASMLSLYILYIQRKCLVTCIISVNH